MKTQNLQTLFEELIVAAQDPSADAMDHYLSKMHVLAEAGYMEAFPFLVQLLNDSRSDWVEHAILALGFHYRLDPQGAEVMKIQQLLASHPDGYVRLAAASVLGGRSSYPDRFLLRTLQTDIDIGVRKSAFFSLLTLAGISFPESRQIEDHLENSDEQLDLHKLIEILRQHGKEDLAENLLHIDTSD